MADARLSAEWSQTGEILAMLINTSMGAKKKTYTIADFSPYHGKPTPQVTKITFEQAMKRFPGGKA